MTLIQAIYTFVNLGIQPEDGFHERRKVQISNYLLMYLFLLNVGNAFAFGLYYWQPILFWDAISSILFSILGYGLHYIGYRVFTRHLLTIAAIGSLVNISYNFGDETGIHFYILFLTIVAFLLYDNYLTILVYTVLIALVYIFHDVYFQHHPQISDSHLAFAYYPNFGLAFAMYIFVLYSFRFESDRYQEIVELQNKDLSALSFKMMMQKDDALIASNQLKQKTSLLEKQNKSIYDSLRLASMLQHETLPSEEELFQGLKSGMLLYKPKDVVSGDFFWAKRNYEGLILIIADCIGHGVPGGMMAVFASNLITQIVEEQGKTFPSDILEELDRRLKRRMKQDPNSDLGDGMDIAVCLIGESTLSFASAARPLVRVSENGETQVISGTRFQLASWRKEQTEYETIEIPIASGDRFYLFTDGAPDQLNGTSGKRLSTKNLVSELAQIHLLPFPKQKSELESLLLSWQGEAPQTDDILLLGFEV
jgi:serine phosphatase RsbU (regulator of sigma subunit)